MWGNGTNGNGVLNSTSEGVVISEPPPPPCALTSCPRKDMVIKNCLCEPPPCIYPPNCGTKALVNCECIDKLDPCNQYKEIFEYNFENSETLKSSLTRLSDIVNSSNNTHEEGFEIKTDEKIDNITAFTLNTSSTGNNHSIDINLSSYNIIYFHSHPFDSVGLFSFQDLRALLSVYDSLTNKNKQKAIMGIVTPGDDGKAVVYLLKIDNINSLRNYVGRIWNNNKYINIENYENRINKIHEDISEKYSNSTLSREGIYFDHFKGTGLSLYKANNELTNFGRLTAPNTTPVPCNN